jgi:single-strand DNA-binding protein
MSSYNRVILMGNLTRDPELRYIPSGTAVCEFGLAVNDRRKNQQTGEWIEDTQFIEITMWARQAEVASEYLSKGSPVFIEGRLKYDAWEKDGQKHSKLRVVGERMQFIGGRGEGSAPNRHSETDSQPQPVSAGSAGPAGPADPPADDIPF